MGATMWLFYVDEFGDDLMGTVGDDDGTPELNPAYSDWFILSAVGIPSHSRLVLAEQLQSIKTHHFPGWHKRSWRESEIKGRDLKQAANRLASGKIALRPDCFRSLTKQGIHYLCNDLGSVFRKFRPIIYVVAVDKKAMLASEKDLPPVAVAYAYLQQRLALLVEHILGPSEGVLIIADEQSGHEKDFRAGRFHDVRKALAHGLTTQPKFDLLLDKPVWVNANLSKNDREILQLSDIVAFAAGETCLNGRTPDEFYCLWDEIVSCMAEHWRSRKITDGGFTIYPRPRKYPTGL